MGYLLYHYQSGVCLEFKQTPPLLLSKAHLFLGLSQVLWL